MRKLMIAVVLLALVALAVMAGGCTQRGPNPYATTPTPYPGVGVAGYHEKPKTGVPAPPAAAPAGVTNSAAPAPAEAPTATPGAHPG
jgi:hypothetical protein